MLQATDPACAIAESVIVLDRFRGCGLGRLLMIHAERAASASGVTTVFLNTTDKVNFYQAMGYSVCQAPPWSANGKSLPLSEEAQERISALFKGAKASPESGGRQWLSKQLGPSAQQPQP